MNKLIVTLLSVVVSLFVLISCSISQETNDAEDYYWEEYKTSDVSAGDELQFLYHCIGDNFTSPNSFYNKALSAYCEGVCRSLERYPCPQDLRQYFKNTPIDVISPRFRGEDEIIYKENFSQSIEALQESYENGTEYTEEVADWLYYIFFEESWSDAHGGGYESCFSLLFGYRWLQQMCRIHPDFSQECDITSSDGKVAIIDIDEMKSGMSYTIRFYPIFIKNRHDEWIPYIDIDFLPDEIVTLTNRDEEYTFYLVYSKNYPQGCHIFRRNATDIIEELEVSTQHNLYNLLGEDAYGQEWGFDEDGLYWYTTNLYGRTQRIYLNLENWEGYLYTR